MELVSNRTGLNNTDVHSIWSVYDTLFCEVRGNFFLFSSAAFQLKPQGDIYDRHRIIVYFLYLLTDELGFCETQFLFVIDWVTECSDVTIKQQRAMFEVRCELRSRAAAAAAADAALWRESALAAEPLTPCSPH